MKKSVINEVLVIIACSLLSAAAMHIFVLQASFAPSGVEGIATMLQRITGLSAGYYSMLFNVPLLLFAWFKLNKKYVVYTLLFTVVSSVGMIAMEALQVPAYHAGEHIWIPAVVSGVLMGFRTGMIIRMGGSTGGLDIIGCLIQKNRPYLEVETPISILSYIVIGCSYFVYRDVNSILLSMLQVFVFTQAMGKVLHSTRSAVEAKIVTTEPERFMEDILLNLKHTATVLQGEGMFSGEKKYMIITIINVRQMNELTKIVQKYPGTFVYFGSANTVLGNFRWNKDDIPV